MDREILISLELLISLDLVHPTFPNETVTNYFMRTLNKKNKTKQNSSLYCAKAIFDREGLCHSLKEPTEASKK